MTTVIGNISTVEFLISGVVVTGGEGVVVVVETTDLVGVGSGTGEDIIGGVSSITTLSVLSLA